MALPGSLGVHNPPSGIPTHTKAIYLHTYVRTYTHIHIHTHVQTYVHTYWREAPGGRRKVPGTYITWILVGYIHMYIHIQVPPWHHRCGGVGSFGTRGPRHLAKTLSARQARTCFYIVPICVVSEQNLSSANPETGIGATRAPNDRAVHQCFHKFRRCHLRAKVGWGANLTYIHACIHTYIHTYTHTHTYMLTYIHTYVHTYIHTCEARAPPVANI